VELLQGEGLTGERVDDGHRGLAVSLVLAGDDGDLADGGVGCGGVLDLDGVDAAAPEMIMSVIRRPG
jgi:hypothetical protein